MKLDRKTLKWKQKMLDLDVWLSKTLSALLFRIISLMFDPMRWLGCIALVMVAYFIWTWVVHPEHVSRWYETAINEWATIYDWDAWTWIGLIAVGVAPLVVLLLGIGMVAILPHSWRFWGYKQKSDLPPSPFDNTDDDHKS